MGFSGKCYLTWAGLTDPKSFSLHRKIHTLVNKVLWFSRHLKKGFIFTHCRKTLLQHIMEHCHTQITVSGTNYLWTNIMWQIIFKKNRNPHFFFSLHQRRNILKHQSLLQYFAQVFTFFFRNTYSSWIVFPYPKNHRIFQVLSISQYQST